MAAFEYRQAEEIRNAFFRQGVRYLFIGKSGALLLGYPDTTQDADLFLEKSPQNGTAAVAALRELQFRITEEQAAEIERGKDFAQLKNGPFDIDLVFAPDGIERLKTPGGGMSTSKDFPFAIPTTSLRASGRQIAQKIASHCPDWKPSVSIG